MTTQPVSRADSNRPRGRARAKHNGSDGSEPDLRALLRALDAVRDGDFSVRLPLDWTGIEPTASTRSLR